MGRVTGWPDPTNKSGSMLIASQNQIESNVRAEEDLYPCSSSSLQSNAVLIETKD